MERLHGVADASSGVASSIALQCSLHSRVVHLETSRFSAKNPIEHLL
jgi:hypothetical protein